MTGSQGKLHSTMDSATDLKRHTADPPKTATPPAEVTDTPGDGAGKTASRPPYPLPSSAFAHHQLSPIPRGTSAEHKERPALPTELVWFAPINHLQMLIHQSRFRLREHRRLDAFWSPHTLR